jgi:NADH-quinone oxidoreductase subunit E
MSVRRLAPQEVQPASFAFSAENLAWVDGQVAKYPAGRQASAIIPLLWKAQEQCGGWLPRAAIEWVAQRLDMAVIRVMEVATFYSMFNLEPVGQYFIQFCGTTPCKLRGADAIKDVLKKRIGEERHVTADGKFSWLEVECLGACCNAPMVQINFDYYEDLTPDSMLKVIDDLAAGRPVKPGPQSERRASEPAGAVTTLTDPSLYDGSVVGSWRKRFDEEAAKAAAAAAAPPAAAPAAAAPPAAPAAPPAPAAPAPAPPAAAPVPTPKATEDAAVSDDHKPVLLTAAREGKADDLKLIWGVGPKLEAMLHGMGVFHFDQIAAWTEMNLKWVDQNLGSFKGRAVRDDWIGQSKKLATGWRPESSVGEKPQS